MREICQLHCRNSDACRRSRRLWGPLLPALWLLAKLRLSVELPSELMALIQSGLATIRHAQATDRLAITATTECAPVRRLLLRFPD
jgi:hypothetical protein